LVVRTLLEGHGKLFLKGENTGPFINVLVWFGL